MSKTTEGAHFSHTIGRTSIPFVIKVLEFLKPFSKGFKWVWAKPTASSLATFRTCPFLLNFYSAEDANAVDVDRNTVGIGGGKIVQPAKD